MANVVPSTDITDRSIVITRTLNAPCDLVFRAWTEVDHLTHWFGPKDFRITSHTIAIEPGGTWRFIMHGPDGTDYPNRIVFLDIVPGKRITYHQDDDNDASEGFDVTITFEARGSATHLTMALVFPSVEACRTVIEVYGAIEGGEQTLDRLADDVVTMMASTWPDGLPEGAFVLSRTLDAPRDLVFAVHSDVDHLRHWWGPVGLTMEHATLDFRVGGRFHYSMTAPDGTPMCGLFVYEEIVAPSHIVYVSSFSDEGGGVTRHPGAPEWPERIRCTMRFTEIDGKTRLDMWAIPVGATAEEHAVFVGGHGSMRLGFGGTIAQLDRYLERVGG